MLAEVPSKPLRLSRINRILRSRLAEVLSKPLRVAPINRILRSWRLGSATPTSRVFGYDRGPQSIARYYIDSFVTEHACAIRGKVLEIGEDRYTSRLGGGCVSRVDVLHVRHGVPGATVVADLSEPNTLASDYYDCVVLTHTLQCINDFKAAIACVYRILVPGGVVLATMSGISQLSRYDMDRWGEYWRFTSLSSKHAFVGTFGEEQVIVRTYGNVLAAVGLVHGLASREINRTELDKVDPDYEVVIGVRAVKSVGDR